MKKFDKIILTIFAIIILAEGVILNLVIVGWLDTLTVYDAVRAMTVEPTNKIVLIIAVIGMLLAIKALFWSTPTTKKEGTNAKDVLMQNDSGRLMISIATLENLVNAVVKQFNSVQDTKTTIKVDNENNVIVLVDLIVMKDVVIKDLSLTIQNKIKEAIKKTSDLDVKEVNVRIKNIVSVPEGENKE